MNLLKKHKQARVTISDFKSSVKENSKLPHAIDTTNDVRMVNEGLRVPKLVIDRTIFKDSGSSAAKLSFNHLVKTKPQSIKDVRDSNIALLLNSKSFNAGGYRLTISNYKA